MGETKFRIRIACRPHKNLCIQLTIQATNPSKRPIRTFNSSVGSLFFIIHLLSSLAIIIIFTWYGTLQFIVICSPNNTFIKEDFVIIIIDGCAWLTVFCWPSWSSNDQQFACIPVGRKYKYQYYCFSIPSYPTLFSTAIENRYWVFYFSRRKII